MPWATPTLKTVRGMTRDFVLSQLGAKAMIPNSVLRIMSDAMSGLAHLVLLYLDWLALQLMPDTAETEWLDRHGNIWLVNADGSTGRKAATYAKGQVSFQGATSTVIPNGTTMTGANGVTYQSLADATISDTGGSAPVVALTTGLIGNLPDGTQLGVIDAPIGLTGALAFGDIDGGTDTESDDELRERVLRRIRQPPMGGAAYDYEAWALAVPGVTRAWCGGPEMGIGTVTTRFMMDDLRASNDGFPLPQDITVVTAYINSKRPVTVKDSFVEAPIPVLVNWRIANLNPDTETVRGNIQQSILDMLFYNAAPGQTIYLAWKYAAVQMAAGVVSFDLLKLARHSNAERRKHGDARQHRLQPPGADYADDCVTAKDVDTAWSISTSGAAAKITPKVCWRCCRSGRRGRAGLKARSCRPSPAFRRFGAS